MPAGRSSKIRFVRVDDRLIHGQVVVAWRQHLSFDAICVVDDRAATDTFLSDVLRTASPADIPTYVYSVRQMASNLEHLDATDILLLVKTPQTVLQLNDSGIHIEQINVGNIAAAPGRKRVFKSISLGPEHVAALDAIAERGIQITFQVAPYDTSTDWQSVRCKTPMARNRPQLSR